MHVKFKGLTNYSLQQMLCSVLIYKMHTTAHAASVLNGWQLLTSDDSDGSSSNPPLVKF